MNLLKETVEILKQNNLTHEDVLWIGNNEIRTDWENFAKIADVQYDSGFGLQEVAIDLIIVGRNWWLERREYDGSEWWEFKQTPEKPKAKVTLFRVVGNIGWGTLNEMNGN